MFSFWFYIQLFLQSTAILYTRFIINFICPFTSLILKALKKDSKKKSKMSHLTNLCLNFCFSDLKRQKWLDMGCRNILTAKQIHLMSNQFEIIVIFILSQTIGQFGSLWIRSNIFSNNHEEGCSNFHSFGCTHHPGRQLDWVGWIYLVRLSFGNFLSTTNLKFCVPFK